MFMFLAVSAPPFVYDGSLRAGQTLTVRDLNGDVRVRTGDRLTVRATRTADRSDPAKVTVRVDQRADGIVVCVRYPGDQDRACDERSPSRLSRDRNDTKVDFDVTVPRDAFVDVATVNGSIDVQHDGAVSAADVNGSIAVDARTITDAKTVNGSLHLRVRAAGHGALNAGDVNGTIDLQLPSAQGFTLDAQTLTGSISAPGIDVERARFGPGASAHGTVGDGALRVTLRTVNGSATVRRR